MASKKKAPATTITEQGDYLNAPSETAYSNGASEQHEKRILQKAADAAAVSGAIDLIDSANWDSISGDVTTLVTRNNAPAVEISMPMR